MDDFAKSVATVQEVVHVYQNVRITLQMGEFNSLFATVMWSRKVIPKRIDQRKKQNLRSGASYFVTSGHALECGQRYS